MDWHALIGEFTSGAITAASIGFLLAPARDAGIVFHAKNISEHSSKISVARAINANSTVGVSLQKAIQLLIYSGASHRLR